MSGITAAQPQVVGRQTVTRRKRKKMKRMSVFVLLAILILSACGPLPTAGPVLIPTPVATSTPTCEPPFIVGATLSEEEIAAVIEDYRERGIELHLVTVPAEEIAKQLGIWPCGEILGDIPVPIYPGAVQSTVVVSLPADVAPLIPGIPIRESRHYLTDDSPEQVLAWYEQTLPEAGFEYKGVFESGVVYFRAGDWHYGLFVTTIQNETYIFIAAGHQ